MLPIQNQCMKMYSITGSSDTWLEIRYIFIEICKKFRMEMYFLQTTVSFSQQLRRRYKYLQAIHDLYCLLPFMYYVYKASYSIYSIELGH